MKWLWKIILVLSLNLLAGQDLFAQGIKDGVGGTSMELIFHLQFLAVVFFVGFAAHLKYLQTRNADFLYASLYLVVNFIYFSRWLGGNLPFVQPLVSVDTFENISTLLGGDFMRCAMEVPLVMLFIITYAQFLITFFEFKEKQPKIHKVLQTGMRFFFGVIAFYLICGLFLYEFNFFQKLVSNRGNLIVSLLFLIPSGFYIQYAIQKGIEKRTRYFWFFIVGTSILILGPLFLAFSYEFVQGLRPIEPFLIFEILVLVEVAFFYQALSIKEDYFYEEKDKTQRELLQQKQENQALQIHKLESDFKALKAQMNPHFIFNSLNSLKALIQQEKSQDAVAYLVKFSYLVRAALEKADASLIGLDEEVEICKNYLAIEKLRMPNLDYHIEIDESLDLSFLEVPPFIIQPFIENALRHGLGLKEGARNLDFIVKAEGEDVLCIIEDNGIGRERAKQMKALNKSERKSSLGINNTKERLKIHQQIYQHPISFQITDKVGKNEEALGTRVEVLIPQ